MKSVIFLTVAILTLSSCMKLKKKGEENAAPVAQAQTTTSAPATVQGRFVNERTELDYDYDVDNTKMLDQVRFKAPLDWPREIVVEKTEGENKFKSGITLNELAEWSDYLTSKAKVNYKFSSRVGDALVLLDEVEVVPALSIELKEDFNLAATYQLTKKTKKIFFKNLEIEEQKHLYIENFSGQIIIEQLRSEGGFIQTFPLEARAALDVDGRSGGQLFVVVASGTGNLTVVMKGENGGHGLSANSPDAALKGTRGSRGKEAQFIPVIANFGGFTAIIPQFQCVAPPLISGNGDQGKQGYPGNDGKKGGNSGTIKLNYNSNALSVSVQTIAGEGGQGSIGGEGGEGGDPGENGDGSVNDLEIFMVKNGYCTVNPATGKCLIPGTTTVNCNRGEFGSRGGRGIPGKPGVKGVSGLSQMGCIYQNGIKVKCVND